MNIITKEPLIKTLPLIAAVAIGLALSPTLSMAGKADSGHQKSQYSHDSGQSHGKAHKKDKYRSDKSIHRKHDRVTHDYGKHGHKYVSKKHYGKPHGFRRGHGYNKKHGHRENHGHNRRGHHRTHYVVNDYDHHDRYIDFDDLRFMIGLHTNNFDIILRD